jgi:putative membrane protein
MSASTTDRSLTRALLLVLAVLLALPVLSMLLFGPMMGMWTVGMGGMMGVAGMGVALLAFLVPLVVVLGGGYLLYRSLDGEGGDDPALEELRMAYARGDLSDEEYERRRERLERD